MRRSKGFTLIEMLLVMMIVGLLTSLIAPRIAANLDSYEADSQLRDVEDQIRQLPRRIRYLGKGLELPRDLGAPDVGDGAPALRLPEGWRLSFSPPLRISRSGACDSSLLELGQGDNKMWVAHYGISEISCELKKLPVPQQ